MKAKYNWRPTQIAYYNPGKERIVLEVENMTAQELASFKASEIGHIYEVAKLEISFEFEDSERALLKDSKAEFNIGEIKPRLKSTLWKYEEWTSPQFLMQKPYTALLDNDADAETFGSVVGDYLYYQIQAELTEPPISLPSLGEKRFEHTYILAGTGAGKTNLLSHMIYEDMIEVAHSRASVIVIESTTTLVDPISRLLEFAPGSPLHGKLVYLDASDVEFPLAMNLFEIGYDRSLPLEPRQAAALRNSSVSLLSYVFRSLLDTGLTTRQSTPFDFAVDLLMQVPGANLDTMLQLMTQPPGIPDFKHYLADCDIETQQYFKLKFDDPSFIETRSQVTDRIFAVKRMPQLRNIISAPQSKIDFFKEMGEGKVILIKLPSSVLGREGVEILGRLFLALILFAAEKRQTLSSHLMPTYLFIDEAHHIVRRDESLADIIAGARKYRVGLTAAHQWLAQIESETAQAALLSVSTKFAARLRDVDASIMARNMNTTDQVIKQLPDKTFALSVLGYPIQQVKYPRVDFKEMLQMNGDVYKEMLQDMRERYANPLALLQHRKRLIEEARKPEPVKKPRRPTRKGSSGIEPSDDF